MPKRLFVAIDLPESTRQLLAGIDPHIRGVRWVDTAQMHLTISFFGDVPNDIGLAVREKLSEIEFGAFFLPIVGVGTFSAKRDRKSTRLNSSHVAISYAVFCLKKKN